MYNNISLFVSASRESYMTQHLMLRLLEEQRQNLDKNVVGGVLMDLSKVFDCVPRDLLFANLAAYGGDESTLYCVCMNRKTLCNCMCCFSFPPSSRFPTSRLRDVGICIPDFGNLSICRTMAVGSAFSKIFMSKRI